VEPLGSKLEVHVKLLTVLINYKTAEMTLRSLDALLRETAGIPGCHVTVVDNDSQDGSFDTLKAGVEARGVGDRVKVEASARNGGFAYGVNWAVQPNLAGPDKADYYYLLNSDAFPDPGSIRKLIDFLDSHPEAGIAGSYIHGEDGEPHHTAFRFPTIVSEIESTLSFGPVSKLLDKWVVPLPMPTETTKVDWLAGASMLIRRQVFEAIGMFDDTFFLYFEETDFCRRAALAGFATYYVRESSVAHIGSVSTGMKKKDRPTPRYWFESRRHFFEKNYGKRYLQASNVVYVVGSALYSVRSKLQNKPARQPKGHLRDFVKINFLE
jgi:N-acetylglucosaminyl-diphospho-decaprenol L-rhamnosyltransferase